MSFAIKVAREADGRWSAGVTSFPSVLAHGTTCAEAVERAKVMSLRALADRIEHGEAVLDLDPVFTVVPTSINSPPPTARLNLEDKPTIQQLEDLLVSCDDTAAHHVLWVNERGDVLVTRVAQAQCGAEFEKAHPEMRVRCETFLRGNGYVGLRAVANKDWLTELFGLLLDAWQRSKISAQVAFIGPL